VTNVEHEANTFGLRLALQGMDGAVYGPLTSDSRYLVTSDEDWSGPGRNAALRSPFVLAASAWGKRNWSVWWASRWCGKVPPPQEKAQLEPALRRFATAAGLSFRGVGFCRHLERHLRHSR